MTEFLSFNLQQAYEDVKQRAEESAVTNKEAWDSMVDDYITERLEVGELDSDSDSQNMIEQLKSRWPEYEKNINIR